jgi:hypothetical protein
MLLKPRRRVGYVSPGVGLMPPNRMQTAWCLPLHHSLPRSTASQSIQGRFQCSLSRLFPFSRSRFKHHFLQISNVALLSRREDRDAMLSTPPNCLGMKERPILSTTCRSSSTHDYLVTMHPRPCRCSGETQHSEQINAPLHLPVTNKRPHNIRPHPSTSFGTDTDSTIGHIAITILLETNETHCASRSCRTTNRSWLQRIRFVAFEFGRVEADATSSCFSGASTCRSAVIVAKTQKLAVGVAGRRHAHAIATVFADGARVATSTAMLIRCAEVLASAVAESNTFSSAYRRCKCWIAW